MSMMLRALSVVGALGALALPAIAQAQASPSAFTSATRYDAGRRVVGTISPDPDGSGPIAYAAVRITYDAAGRLTKVEKGELSSWQAETVAPAFWSGFTVFQTIDTTYDAMSRKLTETVSSGGTAYGLTQYSYDALGGLECTAVRMNPAAYGSLPSSACTLGTAGGFGPDRITRQLYDAAGQLLKVQKAYGTSLQQDYATYTYSANGKQTSMTDANDNKASMTYDGFDRQVAWNFPSKTTPGSVSTTDYEAYGYDANGNRTSFRKRDAQVIGYSYDALNRVTVKDIPGGTSTDVYYGYDLQGLQTYARFGSSAGEGVNQGYDGFGRLTTSTTTMAGYSRTLTYEWDVDGNRVRVIHPDGHFFRYYYDGLDRFGYVNIDDVTGLAAMEFDAQGRRASKVSAGTTTYSYDAVSRLSGMTADYGTVAWAVTSTFGYNPASQIITKTRDNDAYAFSGYTNVNRSYAANGLNQYTSAGPASFSYDANGNLTGDGTNSYAYDVENRLVSKSVSGTVTAQLVYDPLGRLFQTSGSTTGVTQFLYDGDALVAEYDGAGTLLRRYMHGAGEDEPLLWYEGSGVALSALRILKSDQQGSIIAVTNTGAAVLGYNAYEEYGIPNAGNIGRFQYTGQAWIPELGMYYYKARIYSPTLGRFMQTDPIGYQDQVNLYAYVANDPVNGRDPSGNACENADGGACPKAEDHTFRDRMAVAGAAAGAIVGGVAGGTAGGTGGAVAGAACGPGAVACSPAGAAVGATAGAAAGAAGGAVVGGIAGGLIGATIDKGIALFNKATGDASTPTGRSGSPINVKPGTNAPTRIGGREYSGHSLDRMQGRGVTPSVVENAIQNGTTSAGNASGTFVHAGDGVTVITNSAGRVITVITK